MSLLTVDFLPVLLTVSIQVQDSFFFLAEFYVLEWTHYLILPKLAYVDLVIQCVIF